MNPRIFALMMTLLLMDGCRDFNKKQCHTTKHSDDELAELKGLKRFSYGCNYVYAINQKNADKKAKKRGYI